jgi:hypothetical protein
LSLLCLVVFSGLQWHLFTGTMTGLVCEERSGLVID